MTSYERGNKEGLGKIWNPQILQKIFGFQQIPLNKSSLVKLNIFS